MPDSIGVVARADEAERAPHTLEQKPPGSEQPRQPDDEQGSGQAPREPGSGQAPREPGSGQAPREPGSGQAPREPGSGQAPREPGFGERGRMRRRARFLRKARELAYRDLGGLVFDLHRFGQRNDQLVLLKLDTLRRLDTELRELEGALRDRRPVTVLREVGIAACPRCSAIHGSDDRFCPGCGLPFDAHADLPISTAPVVPQAQTSPPRAQPTTPRANVPGTTTAPAPSAPTPLAPTPSAPTPPAPTPPASAKPASSPSPPPPARPKRDEEDEPTQILHPPTGGA
jgi:hypothetical protein